MRFLLLLSWCTLRTHTVVWRCVGAAAWCMSVGGAEERSPQMSPSAAACWDQPPTQTAPAHYLTRSPPSIHNQSSSSAGRSTYRRKQYRHYEGKELLRHSSHTHLTHLLLWFLTLYDPLLSMEMEKGCQRVKSSTSTCTSLHSLQHCTQTHLWPKEFL